MNLTMKNLATDSLRHVEQQLTALIVSPEVKPSDIKQAAEVFATTRNVAYNMLIGASDSSPGYEEIDFPREIKNQLARVDRLIHVATVFGSA